MHMKEIASAIDISVLVPSRGRPDKLISMIKSALATAANSNRIEFCVWIDDDDSSYDSLLNSSLDLPIKVLRGPRALLNMMYNSLLIIARGNYFLWGGDDTQFRTNSWDQLLIEGINKFQDKVGVVYVNDLGKYNQIWATVGMVHRNWIDSFGYLFSPHMRDNGADGWITDVARQVNRCTFFDDVIIEHMQHRQGKAETDATYEDRNSSNQWNDLHGLYRLLRDERRREALYLSIIWPNIHIEFKYRYLIATIYVELRRKWKPLSKRREVYFLSMSNKKFLLRALNALFLKNNYQWR